MPYRNNLHCLAGINAMLCIWVHITVFLCTLFLWGGPFSLNVPWKTFVMKHVVVALSKMFRRMFIFRHPPLILNITSLTNISAKKNQKSSQIFTNTFCKILSCIFWILIHVAFPAHLNTPNYYIFHIFITAAISISIISFTYLESTPVSCVLSETGLNQSLDV